MEFFTLVVATGGNVVRNLKPLKGEASSYTVAGGTADPRESLALIAYLSNSRNGAEALVLEGAGQLGTIAATEIFFSADGFRKVVEWAVRKSIPMILETPRDVVSMSPQIGLVKSRFDTGVAYNNSHRDAISGEAERLKLVGVGKKGKGGGCKH